MPFASGRKPAAVRVFDSFGFALVLVRAVQVRSLAVLHKAGYRASRAPHGRRYYHYCTT